MQLTEKERRMEQGKFGEAKEKCIKIVIGLADAYGAEELVPISAAHIDANSYGRVSGDAKLDFARKIVDMGGEVSVPTTLNPGGRDIERWQEFKLPEDFAQNCERIEKAFLELGAIPTWTCAPYSYGTIPCKGEQVAYAESNAIGFANSVLGARTPRYGDFFEICAAVTGRAPKFDLHLEENRKADLWLDVQDPGPFSFADDLFYALLGYVAGAKSGGDVPVITGVPQGASRQNLKALSAAAASSGGVGLFHVAGVTPEAPSLDAVWPDGVQKQRIEVTGDDLMEARDQLAFQGEKEVDLVLTGCPHFSLPEFEELDRLLAGREVAEAVEFWVQTNRGVYSWVEEMGILERLKRAGVRVSTDSCIFNWPLDNWDFAVALTDSAKFAHYAPNDLELDVSVAELSDCVEAAVSGRYEAGGRYE